MDFLSILILKRKYCKFREINSEFVDSRLGVWSDEEVGRYFSTINLTINLKMSWRLKIEDLLAALWKKLAGCNVEISDNDLKKFG